MSLEQGLWGDVWFWEGDFDPVCPMGLVNAVSREVRIYSAASRDEVEKIEDDPGFYSEIETEIVATAVSNIDGFFELELPPGRYTVFVVDSDALYAPLPDQEGDVSVIEIEAERPTGTRLDIIWAIEREPCCRW